MPSSFTKLFINRSLSTSQEVSSIILLLQMGKWKYRGNQAAEEYRLKMNACLPSSWVRLHETLTAVS